MLLSRELLQTVADIAVRAGEQILDVYQRPGLPEISHKPDDSPLTEADLRAHQLIVKELTRLMPVLPVLSEESALSAFDERRQWTHYWLVDPLDGTKEFISRNGEFTVNIALIKHGQPVLGVVYMPVTGVTYAGVSDGSIQFAWCRTKTQEQRLLCARVLPAPEQWPHSVLRVVASRRHGSDRLEDLLTGWRKKFADVQLVNMGSSLKICLIADGKADIYPRFAPTSEWDTAAAHAVLRAAGGEVVDDALKPLVYNRKESILNPDFIALAQLSEPIKELLCAKPSPNE